MLAFREMIDRIDRRMQLMNQMMARVGVEAPERMSNGSRGGFRSAAFQCLGCDSESNCREWLGAVGDPNAEDAPAFCPNRRYFDSLK